MDVQVEFFWKNSGIFSDQVVLRSGWSCSADRQGIAECKIFQTVSTWPPTLHFRIRLLVSPNLLWNGNKPLLLRTLTYPHLFAILVVISLALWRFRWLGSLHCPYIEHFTQWQMASPPNVYCWHIPGYSSPAHRHSLPVLTYHASRQR